MNKHGLGQPYWNAHQVYTWVYTRNPRLVALLSDRDEGDSVEPSVIDFFAMTGRPGAEFADYAEAQEAIVSTLQEGRLLSLGRREGAGALEEIPAVEWVDLHFVWSVFHGLVEAVGMTDDPPSSIVGAPRWYGLRFKRDDVRELWPPTETEVETGAEDPPAQTLPPHDEPDPKTDAENVVPQCDAREGEQDAPSPSPQRKKAANRRFGGRKKGSGSLASKDTPLLDVMKPLIADGTSQWAAAMTVVSKAAGHGSDESKVKRLVARFREREKNNSV